MAGPKEQLRLFNTLERKRTSGSREVAAQKQRAEALAAALAAPSSRGLFHALSSAHDLATSQLIIQCIALGYTSSNSALPGFDRGSSSGAGAEQPAAAEGALAAALAEHLVPGWWYTTHAVPAWRWQLAALLEAPCFGVPGLSRFTMARAAFLAHQVQLCVDADGCRQVVLLRSGFSTWAHSLAQPGVQVRLGGVAVLHSRPSLALNTAHPSPCSPPPPCRLQFYEVDSREAVSKKKAALDAVLPGWRAAARRPRFVEGEWAPLHAGYACADAARPLQTSFCPLLKRLPSLPSPPSRCSRLRDRLWAANTDH